MVRVLIVEDSRTVSQYLEFILSGDPEIEVVGNVANGREAVEFVRKNKPDVISMDIDMPVMNGLEATRIIMSSTPVPIIVVTASRNAHKVNTSIDALAAGALTVIQKPVGIGHPNEIEKTSRLLSMLKTYAQVKVITRKFNALPGEVLPFLNENRDSEVSVDSFKNMKLVAIGISSGGPQVLEKIFRDISKDFPYPIVVVQHITKGFLEGMVLWLSRICKIPIRIARDKEHLLPGCVYFAPDCCQLSLEFNVTKLHKCSSAEAICPSVSWFFNSLLKHHAKETIAMILTGMGRDGADQIKMLKGAGALTIAQDKESSLVHGMPGEAIKIGGVDHLMNPEQIADMLLQLELEVVKSK